MIAYSSYYNPKVYNSKDMIKTMEQLAHQMNMVQQHDYLDMDENQIAHNVPASSP